MSASVISVDGLDVYYGKSQILFGVGFEVPQGETVTLLGRNGAGKSTTMKAIAGLAPPKKGPAGEQYWTLQRIYDTFPLLTPLKTRMAGRLSGGEQQMLSIARTLMGNPVALLLDEPSEGLAPIVVQRITEVLKELRKTGATILIAEQNMHFCLGIASRALVIDKGQIVYRDTIEKLKANDDIRRKYLAM